MREIGVLEAKNTFPTLLDAVERGEEIVITRHGKPVARLVRSGDVANWQKAAAAVERMRELRKGIRLGDDLTTKDLINAGRR